MKTIKLFTISLFTLAFFASCSDDDTSAPINEEEVITTLKLTLLPQSGGESVVFQSKDADGDGPNAPVITVSRDLTANTLYNVSAEFLNELESPTEDITEEISAEADEHQVLYNFIGASGSTVTYNDMDGNGNPLGINVTLNAGTTSTGNTLTVVLKHEPTKPNDGTVSGAGGETDIEATFTFNVN